MPTSIDNNDAAPSTEVLRVGDYPFYRTQPTKEMDRLTEYLTTYLTERIPEIKDEVVAIFPVGSGAISGMPGPAQIDLQVVLKREPGQSEEVLAAAQIAALESELNFLYKGPSPHHPEGDVWLRNEDSDDPLHSHVTTGGTSAHWEDGVAHRFKPGDLGSCNLHVVRIGDGDEPDQKLREKDGRTREYVLRMVAYVDYLTQNRDAFERYANVKLEGAEMVTKQSQGAPSGDVVALLFAYKKHKSTVAIKLNDEIKEWRIRGEWEMPAMSEEACRYLVPDKE